MTLLLLAAVLIGFILIFKTAQQSTRIAIEPIVEGPIDAVEFFWRPG